MFEIKDIILIVLVIAVVYLIYKTRKLENFETITLNDIKNEVNNKYTADIDAIRNLASIAKNIMTNNDTLTLPATTTTANNMNMNGDLRINGTSTMNNNLTVNGTSTLTGNITANGNITARNIAVDKLQINGTANSFCINDLCLDKSKFERLMSVGTLAGYAVVNLIVFFTRDTDKTYFTTPIYEGAYDLDFMNDDKWQHIYLQRGWRITLYETKPNQGQSAVLQNIDSVVPLKLYPPASLSGKVSSYKAEWIGFNTTAAATTTTAR